MIYNPKLSKRAIDYLESQKRDLDWISDLEQAKIYFDKNPFINCQKFIEFQKFYAGYTLTIDGKTNETLEAFLLSPGIIDHSEKYKLELFESIEGTRIEVCAEIGNDVSIYVLTENGEFGWFEDNKVTVVSSSFDKIVEQYALENEHCTWEKSPRSFVLENHHDYLNFVKNQFDEIKECSDSFSSRWKSEEMILVCNPFRYNNGKLITSISKSLSVSEKLFDTLLEKKIIRNFKKGDIL